MLQESSQLAVAVGGYPQAGASVVERRCGSCWRAKLPMVPWYSRTTAVVGLLEVAPSTRLSNGRAARDGNGSTSRRRPAIGLTRDHRNESKGDRRTSNRTDRRQAPEPASGVNQAANDSGPRASFRRQTPGNDIDGDVERRRSARHSAVDRHNPRTRHDASQRPDRDTRTRRREEDATGTREHAGATDASSGGSESAGRSRTDDIQRGRSTPKADHEGGNPAPAQSGARTGGAERRKGHHPHEPRRAARPTAEPPSGTASTRAA